MDKSCSFQWSGHSTMVSELLKDGALCLMAGVEGAVHLSPWT
uniref:Uncharacterized protein n=1 Tax=Anguilla anguilla TaxID=7936 RepID=A0A0E9SHJ3_ANGAN